MNRILKIFAFCILAHTAHGQCDTTGILLELQATTNLQGLIIAVDRCLTSATVLSPLIVSGDTLSIDTTAFGGGTVTSVAATAPAAGFTISGSPITTSGTFVFSLADDLAALEALSTTGIAVRTAANTWTTRTITAGTGAITVDNGDGVGGNPTVNNTDPDQSTTNEVQTYAHAGTTTYTNTLSLGGGTWSITGAGIAAISQTAGAITVTATEVDGSITNEGLLGVGAGGATSSVLLSNTSTAAGVTINAAGINAISETVSGNGGQITITATEVDGSISNELQTIANTSNATSHTATLSNTGGSLQLIEGTGITLTTGGTGLDGTVTIASTAGTNYQTWRDDGTPATQRPNANFVSTATVTMTLTDDAGNTETEVTANVPTDGITSAQIAASAVGTSEIADGAVATADLANQSVTYVKMQNAAADNVLLGNNNGANTSFEELNATAVQTMLGYVDGLTLAAQRIAFGSDANTIEGEAAFLYDKTNDRQTIVCTTPSFGAGAAILNLSNAGTDDNGEFLGMRGSITNLLTAVLINSSTAATSGTLFNISQAGNGAGDPWVQFQISGTGGNTTSVGLDNSDVNKFKITPNSATVGGNVNASFVATQDAIPSYGFDIDAPGRTVDVGGGARAVNLINTSAPPTWSLLDTGLGTGGTVNSTTGGNNGFQVNFTTGTGPAADGVLFRLTLANQFTTTQTPVIFCKSVSALNECSKFSINGNSPAFITLKANGTLTASTNYILNIVTVGQ